MNMKRKLAGASLALMTTLAGAAFAGPVMADEGEATAPYVVDTSQDGSSSITIFKHERVAGNALVEGDGSEQSISSPTIEGINFNLRQVIAVGDTAISDLDYTQNESWYTLSNLITDTGDLTGNATYAGDGVTKTTNGEGKIEFDGLSFGLYEVREMGWAPGQGNGKTVVKSAPFFITLPFVSRVAESGTPAWNYHPIAYPKNQLVTAKKTVEDITTLNYGKELSWTITSPIAPKNGGTNDRYIITDKLDKRTAYQGATLRISDGTELVATDDYTVDPATAVDEGGQKVVITFTPAGLAKLDTTFAADPANTIETVLRAKIVQADDDGATAVHTITNQAFIVPSSDPSWTDGTNGGDGDTPGLPTNEVKTYYGGVQIDKTAAEDEEVKLAGAKFHNAKRRLSVLVFC